MKKFNINNYIYVQVTKPGWERLRKTVGDDYIKHSIKSKETTINGETWYKLQGHEVFFLFSGWTYMEPMISATIMFDDESLTSYTITHNENDND